MSFTATQEAEFNAMFGELANQGQEGLDKLASAGGLYIQEKLRENAFSKQILPPETVTMDDVTRNPDDEGFIYIDDLEPDSIAMRINMRGEPQKTYIQAPRYTIQFQTISSDRFQKAEQELRTYRAPITKIIEQNTIKDIQEQMDLRFMEHVRAGLMFATIARKNELIDAGAVADHLNAAGVPQAANQRTQDFYNEFAFASYLFTRKVALVADGGALGAGEASWGAFTAASAGYNPATGLHSNIIMSEESVFTRRVVTAGAKIAAAREMKCKCFLMHEFDFVDSSSWTQDDAGLEVLKEILVSGYKYRTIGGFTYITTVRNNPDILSPGQIYCFPAPEFLGRFLVLQGTQFYINKQGRFFNMEAWEECGVGFGNIRGLGLVLLAGATIELPRVFVAADGETVNEGGKAGVGAPFVGTFTLKNDPADPTNAAGE